MLYPFELRARGVNSLDSSIWLLITAGADGPSGIPAKRWAMTPCSAWGCWA